ncbi:glutathione S-transferase-like [Hydractinia symbiolongicarpus]|uniref:glutathione S-transferase-like n=1 Tax=Hydractinia symbiolongicarpus TaxID=13093 RepID=UPI00254FA620|nr:glutathione S-transferase-like [Hydractinia symbiolongicarpus]
MTAKYSLLYFDLRARGEAIRMLFKHAGVDFEDKKITFAEFPEVKADVTKTPSGSLPVLTTPCGKKIVQTTAILRYVANELNLYGNGNVERAMIDAIVDTHKEVHDLMISLEFGTKDEDKPEKRKQLENTIHKSFKFYEIFIKDNESKDHFVGKAISLADIYFVDVVDYMNVSLPENKILEQYAVLKNIDSKTREAENIKKYLSERK